MFTFLRQAEPETMEISRAADVFETTVQILKAKARLRYKRDLTVPELLSWEDVELIAELSGCPPPTHPAICLQHSHLDKYRSISGLCNNRQNPLWGAANTALVRWLPAEYEDGERQAKGWNHEALYNGVQLPLVHKVSKNIMKTSSKRRDAVYTQLLVEFGQYIDHDINLTPQLNKGATCANTCENAHPCFPIQFHNVPSGAQSCMPFYRSSPACFANFGSDIKQILQRQQMNAITSFIDASAVYGCTPKLQSLLRDLTSPDGRLATNNHFQDLRGRPYLPFVSSVESSCLQDPRDLQGQRMECFLAGDKRVNEVPTLISLHTLFVREHNRIAKALKGLNGHWSRETVYQETRKIIGALHQIITMRDYIPKIIGSDGFDSYIGPYGGYDPAVDPSASNVFTTAAFRFGHATISPVIWRLNESFQEDEHFPHLTVYSALFSPWKIYREGGIDPIIRGVIGTAAIAVSTDKLIPEAVTEKMVVPFIPQDIDLAAVDLQRGRDHALPGYNDWRAFCGLKRIMTQDDLRDVVKDSRVAQKILQMYKHPDNIDVWLGGLVEDLLPGSRNGPLFSCLIGKQMKALRDGDRHTPAQQGPLGVQCLPQGHFEVLTGETGIEP
ncbi:thyroid peroxidase [Polymixia lowei]